MEKNTTARNIASTVSINYYDKKRRNKTDCYTLKKFLLVMILLVLIGVICYYYPKSEKHFQLKKWIKIMN